MAHKDRPLLLMRTSTIDLTQLSPNLVKMPTMSKCFSMTQILTAKAIVIRINVKSSSYTFFSNKMSTIVNDEAYKDSEFYKSTFGFQDRLFSGHKTVQFDESSGSSIF